MRLKLNPLPKVRNFKPVSYFFGKSVTTKRSFIGCNYTHTVNYKRYSNTCILAYTKYPVKVEKVGKVVFCNYVFNRIDLKEKIIVVKRKKK